MKRRKDLGYIFANWGLYLMTHSEGEYIVFMPKAKGKTYYTTFTLEKLEKMSLEALDDVGKFTNSMCYVASEKGRQ